MSMNEPSFAGWRRSLVTGRSTPPSSYAQRATRPRTGQSSALPRPRRPLQLTNKSLVQVDQGSGRYRLLETMRLYAQEKLAASGEYEKVAARHFDWYLAFVESGSAQVSGPRQLEWFLRLEREHPNLRAALERTIEGGRTEEAARLALALLNFWLARAYHREAECWLAEILELPATAALAAQLRARLLGAQGAMAYRLNDFEQADQCLNEALSIWRKLETRAGTAIVLKDLAWERFQEMDLVAARRYAEESVALAREAGDPELLAIALQTLALPLVEAGEIDSAVPVMEECLSIWQALGRQPEISRAHAPRLHAPSRSGRTWNVPPPSCWTACSSLPHLVIMTT